MALVHTFVACTLVLSHSLFLVCLTISLVPPPAAVVGAIGAGCVVRPLSTGCAALHFNSKGIARLKEQAALRGRPDPFEVRYHDTVAHLTSLGAALSVAHLAHPHPHAQHHRCDTQGKPRVWYATTQNNDTSAWKLNLVARVVRGLPVDNAITQVCPEDIRYTSLCPLSASVHGRWIVTVLTIP